QTIQFTDLQEAGAFKGYFDANARVDADATAIIEKRYNQKVVSDLESKNKAFNAVLYSATRRAGLGIVIGAMWLGPARLAFATPNAMLFSFGGRNVPQHVLLFAGGGTIGKFREATDVFGMGRVMELVSGYFGGGVLPPEKAFKPGSLFFINKPEDALVDSSEQAWTHIFTKDGSWTINTNWKQKSFVTAFEDVRGFGESDKFTSLQTSAYNAFPDSIKLNRKEAAATLSYLSGLAVPWIVTYAVIRDSSFGVLGIASALVLNEVIMKVDPNEFKGIDCDYAKLSEFKKQYSAVMVGGWISSYALPFLGLFRTRLATALNSFLQQGPLLNLGSYQGVTNVINQLNIATALQWWILSRAQNYVASCKDPEHLIFAYQELKPTVKKTASTANDKLSSITDAIANLKLGQAAAQAAAQNGTPLSQMKEILNVKLGMENQYGNIQPEDIFYLQIERSAFSVKSRLWEMLNGENCRFVENYQSGDKTARFDVNGINFYDKQGRLLAQFNDYAWRLRSLGRLRSQELARVILPNKIIQAQLACGDTPFLEVKAGGSPALVGSCETAECLKARIFEVTGRSVDATGDLTPFLGRISSVDTSDGIAAVEQNAIRFTRLVASSGKNGAKKGSEVSAPSIDDYASLGTRLEGSKLTVLGNGAVVLDGPPGSTVTGESLGEIRTIIGDRGKLEYDPSTGNLVLFIYVLADELAANVNKIGVTPAKNALSDGTTANAIKMDTGEKTGLSDDFRNALKSIQGEGGMQSWEDENHLFYLTKDAAGNDVLRVVDKKTGEVTDYKITGDPYLDANGRLVIPTEKGDFKFW
ncbi:MAG: hypothetical protein V1817_04855, partial [Candidatus Micrarchaeota archaeon]